MPGSVFDIKVNAGDKVEAGDVLLVLEAMKMEINVPAPEDGTVESIDCEKGQMVEAGTPLVTLA
jgi:glutaconyl-CoA decarboxylase